MGESAIAANSSIDNRLGVHNACPTKLGTDLSIVDGVPPQSGLGLSSAFAIVSFVGYPFDPKLSGAYG